MKQKKFSVMSVLLMVVLLFYSVLLVSMFCWCLLNSVKDGIDMSTRPFGLPQFWMFENYAAVFKYMRVQTISTPIRWVYFEEMFLNSILYSLGCTIAATMTPCIVAYLTAKYNFRLNKVIHGLVIITMILPIVGSLPSELSLVKALNFYDHIWGMYILKANFLGMYFLVFYATFRSLSWEYAEAAFVDGASHFTVMTRIMLPLVKSTILAVGVMVFIGFWNDYQTPMIYMPSHATISFGLFQFTNASGGSPSEVLAASIVVMLPMLIIFIIFKDKFIGNLTVGGIKG